MKREAQYPIKYLSISDWDKLCSLKHARRDGLILKLLYHAGCTVNELVNLRVSDFDLRRNIVLIRGDSSRNKSPREVYLSRNVMEEVLVYISKERLSGFLFSTRQSTKMTTKRVRQIVGRLCSKINVKDATPQLLRYTHMVHAYMKGIPIDAIQQQTGLRRSRAIEVFNQLKLTVAKDAYKAFDS